MQMTKWQICTHTQYSFFPLKTVIPHFLCVQFSRSVMSDSFWPHGLQHSRLPCPSPTPGACSNSCPLHWWYHPTILSSVVPFSSCLHFFPVSGSFPGSQFFASGGQSIGVSNEYSGLISSRMDWLDLLVVQGTLKSLLQHHSSKASILLHSAFFIVQLSHPYMTTGKTIALTRWTFVGKVMSLLFNVLSRLIYRVKHDKTFDRHEPWCWIPGYHISKSSNVMANAFPRKVLN